jgi:hypothetical protein
MDGLENSEGGAISGAARIAIEKLTEAMKLLDQAEAEAQAVDRRAISIGGLEGIVLARFGQAVGFNVVWQHRHFPRPRNACAPRRQ